MPDDLVFFDKQAEKRIARAVLRSERAARDHRLPRRRSMRRTKPGFIAKYAGCCKLNEATPGAQSANTLVMTHAVAGPAASPVDAAGAEFRLAVKFDKPWERLAGQAWVTCLQLKNEVTWNTANAGHFLAGFNIYAAYIKADFDYEGAGCATWTSLNCKPFGDANWPSTDTFVPQFWRDGANLDIDELAAPQTIQFVDESPSDAQGRTIYLGTPGAVDTPVYGIMICFGEWTGAGGGNLDTLSAITTLLNTSILHAVKL